MKLATLKDGTRDGRLIVVKRDNSAYALATNVALTLQAALDDWGVREPQLRALAAQLEAGTVQSRPLDVGALLAPLPRAYEWLDGSAYLNHVLLVRKARGAEPPATLKTDPLVYQGGSGEFLAPTADIPLADEAWGLDFESEVCVVLGDTPQGTKAEQAGEHIRLLMICNDVSLRNLIPDELAKGFGFVQSKPATAFGPFALTPDELEPAWREGRVHLRMRSILNGELVGDTDAGPEMHFSFHELIQHLCKTRGFTAGTVLGSGTVSNADRARGISCLAERRMIETIEEGKPRTPFMKPGDTIDIEMLNAEGQSLFGRISQKVVKR
ncbi:fumarylacetoacetate hydrolase family protein [Stigmatella aurantiaca]|uniref:Fumarylacetoacetate (FAA) hydrolase n=1 Tax=Stigmatella aurantiaca (strain DW4/3-1) TaxID=378806 RepID=Q08WC3_STIAD|nr:fumarylacetoacetate hydrolase family protein [Stigmatella aurantiaca]ADO69264.1 fumarylacetoacetate hydrolase [Stigmatella aurantiaca DW4/3-1]EAU64778.1 fumarylacetoacetate (FAA) hydrolase [Stigmatella aurantiaca DW4/3-1]